MKDPEEKPITLTPARTGRHRTPRKPMDPDELVRVEIRLPAATAARLYRRAHEIHQPISTTATELINRGLDGGDPGAGGGPLT